MLSHQSIRDTEGETSSSANCVQAPLCASNSIFSLS